MNSLPRIVTPISAFLLLLIFSTEPLVAQNQPSASMMRFPDVSAEHIVFAYANDLWIVAREGGTATLLANPQGAERMPRFSPDGKDIAFLGNYDGGDDLYVLPVAGGMAERLTYHPSTEVVCDWMPDGKSLLFYSNGLAGHRSTPQLFTVSKSEPLPKKLPVPYGTNGAVSSDGVWLAYTPQSRDTRTWKRYRGGMASDVWLFNLKDNSSKQITDFEGTDSLPMWHGTDVYYLSDGGEEARLNIWKYDTTTDERTQITRFKDFDCKWPAIGPGSNGEGEIVFSNGPDLKLLNLGTNDTKSIQVTIPGDRPRLRSQQVDASDFITSGDISPSGKRVCVAARGDIWTLPAEKGPARNLTKTNGVAERFPSWSPDGRWVAYFADATGEYELYVTQSDGRGETKQLTKDGNCFRFNPMWSPDSKHIVFTDKTGAIHLHTIDGETALVDTDPHADQVDVNWSHDSNWLTYSITKDDSAATSVVWVYNVTEATKHQITPGFFNSTSPVFDREGKYLYFASARAFNQPEYEDVGQSFIYANTEVLLAVPLMADAELPMLPESDEEEWEEEEEGDAKSDKKEENQEESKADDSDKEADDKESAKEKKDEDDDSDSDDDEDDEERDALTGTWSAELNADGLPPEARTAVFSLELTDDGTVTGTVDTPDGDTEDIINGKYDADTGKLSFEVKDDDGTITVEATVKDGEMTGTVTIASMEIDFEATRGDDEEGSSGGKKKKAAPLEVEFEGIAKRIFQLPVDQGSFGSLAVNHKNQLIYARRGDGASIKLYDMHDDEPEEKTVVAGAGQFAITADGKKLLVFRRNSGYIVNASAGQKLDDKVPMSGMHVSINPREEWKQVFTDAWRIERDFFYDPNMHGVDWQAIHDRYADMLDDCTSRTDVAFLIREMIAELNVGHAYYRGGGTSEEGKEGSDVGLLGCTFEAEKGRYKIGTIFEGADWDTDARNPLRAVNVKEGQFLLEVNNAELTDGDNPYAFFEGLAGQTATLLISDDENVDDEDRTVVVKLRGSDNNLRFRHWIEAKRKHVDEATKGRVGYIYVVNTGVPGQNDLFRQFYAQQAKDALIIDDRWNGGGQIPTRFIELLNRPVTNFWAKRDGRDWTWPPDSHQGPKCMLINGMAGSGGDMFPALFKQAGLGKLIGRRTWGGLVGISGNPQMIDGSSVTAPTFAFYEKDGTWGIEGHGVDPDIDVIDDPAKMVDGGDPQLDAAIDLMLNEIKTNGYAPPKRPAYPDRSKFGLDPADK